MAKAKKTKNVQKVQQPKKTLISLRKERRKAARHQKRDTKCGIKSMQTLGKVTAARTTSDERHSPPKNADQASRPASQTNKNSNKKKTRQEKQRNVQLRRDNVAEDKEIKRLEKQLGLNKRKNKQKALPLSFTQDGLDYLLNVCDPGKVSCLDDASDTDDEKKDDQDDVFQQSGDESAQEEHEDESAEEENEDESAEEENEDESAEAALEDDQMQGDSGTDSESGDEEDNGECGSDGVHEAADKSSTDKLWEDIYGRTRDAQGNVVSAPHCSSGSKYVPPAMRESSESDAMSSKVIKQMKGLLNRLAESNMHVIVRQMEDMYMSYSRNVMNNCLSKLMVSSLATSVLTPERLIMEHALMVAILHANVGIEVGASLVQNLNDLYQKTLADPSQAEIVECKVLDNFLNILSQFYSFGIVGADLIFDLLSQLVNRPLSEKSVELIVLVLRAAGFQLRKDDPTRLKAFIIELQRHASKAEKEEQQNVNGDGSGGTLSRVLFMLEIVLAIKNNNVKKIPNYDPTHQIHLQKISRTFLRPGCSVTALKVSLDDLINVETRGRWWIVGSAWAGSGHGDRKNTTDGDAQTREAALQPRPARFSLKLLELARKMRMNTDSRKTIFCSLLSAEDYLDAFERLVKVDKGCVAAATKHRDTAFVVLACCLKEPHFNPFYSEVAMKLALFDRKYRMAIQCCVWDRLRQIEALSSSQMSNLALFTSRLIQQHALSLACLKIIEFSDINKHYVTFLKAVIRDLLQDQKRGLEPFTLISGHAKLAHFRESLRLFMRHFMQAGRDQQDDLSVLLHRAEAALMSREKRLAF